MDSLAANYASSSDEDEPRNRNPNPNPNPRPPKPFFSSLPPPKPTTTSSIFSSIPAPKPKKIVQFTPPINPSLLNPDEDDEEDDRKNRKPVFDSSSKPLSSIIPPPKNTFGLAPVGSSFSSRRSIVEADVPVKAAVEERRDVGGYEGYGGDWTGGSALVDASTGWGADGGGYYESFGGNWEYEGSVPYAPAEPVAASTIDVGRIGGKRGRNEIPVDIVEVKQDELVKDRPREDQVKLTGIAFGPAYQPVSSQKGKPSKLHKRKHQIGSLYFDMKQNEMELAERRSRGMLTKKETQGKYGW